LLAALAGCGGGQLVEQFHPARILAFGDEASVITSDGRKYTVNALLPDNMTFDCASNPIWVQVLASGYGLVFQECPGTATSPTSRVAATNGAKAADLVTQVNGYIGSFAAKDLATVLVGSHDVLAAYQTYKAGGATEAVATAQVQAAGAAVAVQVNRIAETGTKVIVSTLPELGLTPYGITEGASAADLLNRLTVSFNLGLLKTLTNDGHKIGLVEPDKMVRNIFNAPANNGYVNWTQAACGAAVLTSCTTTTLLGVMDTTTTSNAGQPASAATWLWAGDLQLGVSGHVGLGTLASARARNNPF
jgi:outer membrane lipase/esterase